MARSPEDIARTLRLLVQPEARGRLLARGLARGMIWRNGQVPDDGPQFQPDLTVDLLHFGYSTLALALELRDANRQRDPSEAYPTDEPFRVAAEAIESAVRRGAPDNPDYARHLVVAAAALHLAGFAARAYSLLPESVLQHRVASAERVLVRLLRRDLSSLRDEVMRWLGDEVHGDDAITKRLEDPEDEFGPEDVAVVALTAEYHRAVGLLDTAMMLGDASAYGESIQRLEAIVSNCATIGNVPLWWVATLTRHLAEDLWGSSLHVRLPVDPSGSEPLPPKWREVRQSLIELFATRNPPQLDLWPSQLEAARRAIDTSDHLITALPTSAGKTRIAELCILRALADGKRVVYVTPLRALSAQVEQTLARTFVPVGASVTSLYGAAGATTTDIKTLVSAEIVVATPEKLDFALRQDPDVLNDVALVVLDEGHMIGANSREIRYEVLIQRLLRRGDAEQRRIVCLSAMFNPEDELFKDFSDWLRRDDPRTPIHVRWRPTRQLLATLERHSSGNAQLSFIEGEKPYVTRFIEVQPPKRQRKRWFPDDDRELCIATANAFARDRHNILVYSPQRSQIEPLVAEFLKIEKQGYLDALSKPPAQELQIASAIGREWLGDKHPAVRGLSIGVGAHHGALPRPFLTAVENLLDRRLLPVVVASPTLAQGIDLKCSVLVFRSLHRFDAASKQMKSIPAAEFANVLGRAGRAFVDLDGIAVYPIFKAGAARRNALNDFQALIKESREQTLLSGLAQVIAQIARQLRERLEVSDDFLEYVLNQRDLWSDPRLELLTDGEEESDDSDERELVDLLADLDVAILSLVERLDAPMEELAVMLDSVLTGSLWSRTLAHLDESIQRIQREVLRSRSEWLWRNTTTDHRRACFSSGLGFRAGVFLYERLDQLVPLLLEFHAGIAQKDPSRATTAACTFAKIVAEAPFFEFRKPPPNWEAVLTAWIRGDAFAAILSGRNKREAQKVQAFVQDTVVFKLVWAAEAVRVQATTKQHPAAEELGDGPSLAFTYGVPTIAAAILCQTGFSSRTGAVWLTDKLDADFSDLPDMNAWLRKNSTTIQAEGFWASTDHEVLWNAWRHVDRRFQPVPWSHGDVEVNPRWNGVPPKTGQRVRLVPGTARSASVCARDLAPLGAIALPFETSNRFLDAHVGAGGRLTVRQFGPE